MAVEDARVLAEELRRADHVTQALESHTRQRFERCKVVVERSREIGRLQVNKAPPPQIFGLMHSTSTVLSQPY
jgi:2-polyprenyl-6-methoxyphenol hydroxylase-like FAD-dependent oxidoreductase